MPIMDNSQSAGENGNNEQGIAAQLENDVRVGERWLIGIGLAALVMNGFIAWVYWNQFKEMQKATEATRHAVSDSNRNFRSDERAWVGITFPNVDFQRESIGKVFEVPMVVTNTGKTPAQHINIKGVVSIVHDRIGNIDIPPSDITHGFSLVRIELLQPNQTIKDWPLAALDTSGPTKPVITTKVIVDHIGNASYTVVIHGRITYEDIFGYKHWLTFCHNANGLVGGSTACFDYNSFDREDSKSQDQ